MKIATFPIRPIQENVYFFYNEKTLDGVVIDPGGDAPRLLKFVEDSGLTIRAILLTHGHFDHILAVEELRSAWQVPVAAHAAETPVLMNQQVNMSAQLSRNVVVLEVDKLLEDGDVITFGQNELLLLHTPGHTPGSCCYYSEQEKVLFTGDTLFYESVGRTDFAMGSLEALLHAIKSKLLVLPDDVRIFPGHGQPSSILHEKQFNPFINMGC